MKRKVLLVVAAVVCMTMIFALGVYAGGNLQAITAYLNYGISVAKDGQEQVLTDANGNMVTPITYNDTTYLPVRAISNLLGHSVGWDAATQCVLLDGSPVPASLTSYSSMGPVDIPWVYGDTYDITFINNLMNSSKTPLVYSDYTLENDIVNGVWKGKEYGLSNGEKSYSFYSLDIMNPNSKYEANQAIVDFEKALCDTLSAGGFTLVKQDEYGTKHFVRGNMEFEVRMYDSYEVSIDLSTKWLTCCADER